MTDPVSATEPIATEVDKPTLAGGSTVIVSYDTITSHDEDDEQQQSQPQPEQPVASPPQIEEQMPSANGTLSQRDGPHHVDDQKTDSQHDEQNPTVGTDSTPTGINDSASIPDIKVSLFSTPGSEPASHPDTASSPPSPQHNSQSVDQEDPSKDPHSESWQHQIQPSEQADPHSEPVPELPVKQSLPQHTQSVIAPDSSSTDQAFSRNPNTATSRRASVTQSPRSSSSTVATGFHSRSSLTSLNKGSAVFVVSALDSIANSKEAKKDKDLKEAAIRALDMVKAVSGSAAPSEQAQAILDPRLVFEPLRLSCRTNNTNLTITSLDCIGKLVSYAFFAEDQPTLPPRNEPQQNGQPPQTLADLVTETVCDCYQENLDDKVALQIIKALLSSVLSTTVHVHQSSLLKAVRTVYNIFLLSKSPANQAVAQGSLTQMVHHVFARVPSQAVSSTSLSTSNSLSEVGSRDQTASLQQRSESISQLSAKMDRNGRSEDDNQTTHPDSTSNEHDHESKSHAEQQPSSEAQPQRTNSSVPTQEKITLQSLETRKSFEGASEKDNGASVAFMSRAELFVKDAFLVMRALCKLTMKPLGTESERDLKSHAMRSKLLSLHLILTIIKTHMGIFNDGSVIIHSASTGEQTALIEAVKQYLCLSLSRNAVSSVNQVFEISCEIFWQVVNGMRSKMKKEIEVLLNEIFLPILEMKTSTAKQKSILLGVLIRLCQDPQALVEIYLNYDCDRTALDNIYERLMNVISKISQTHLSSSVLEGKGEKDTSPAAGSSALQRSSSMGGPALPPTLSTAAQSDVGVGESFSSSANPHQPVEARLKRQSLDCLCSVLRSLVIWANKSSISNDASHSHQPNGDGGASPRPSEDVRAVGNETFAAAFDKENLMESGNASAAGGSAEISRNQTPEPQDDPSRFENAKLRKTTLLEGIKKFNFKPKRGIQDLIKNGFIRSLDAKDIARFLLYADGLNKAQIGEYLGEGEPENIAIMHAFIDLMSFENMGFTDALRKFLQAFRLPGESQKIDRYMLKYAERYVACNPKTFANADTAYVLAYSVIMLNTDAHNPQVKHRMSLQDFIKNNKGIDDGNSLPEDYQRVVYEEIVNHEIKMKDEVLSNPGMPSSSGLVGSIATVGRDLQREAYVLQSEGMANKTEALFRTMVRAQRRVGPQQRAAAEQFFSASHFEHVKPMFEVAWMSFLAGISGPLQDSQDPETVETCLQGFKDAIKIVCFFGLELERNAFVTTLAKFTFLNNLGEMKSKNVEAIKALLGVALSEGNYLKGSWREVLTCVSQLERFQLISGGMDGRQLPELGRRSAAGANSQNASRTRQQVLPNEDVVQAGASSEVTVASDMVFSSSATLSGTAIVDFVQSLSDVSWEEIQSSGMTDNPRLFSLQKLVEISYYNMSRIRMEWSNMWAILGEHFNMVCCHPNPSVSAFGLDSLRQLAMRFLEKEELAHFKFQKDFLKPFEVTMQRNKDSDAKEMVLQCLEQMIHSRANNIRSGWRTMFGVFGTASNAPSEKVSAYAFELVRQLNDKHFGAIIVHGSFADLCICATHFAKANKQKISLQATDLLGSLVAAMLEARECPIDPTADPGPAAVTPMSDDPMVRFWFPVLFAFYDIIMTGDDLEVRRVALDSLFAILKQHGATFRPDFWDTVCQEILFPIFAVLRSRQDVSRFSTQEDMSVWLSTTMIQALRNLIDLWTYYFGILERLLPGLLELLCACICQENDTLARIGTSCLQQLIEKNVDKLSEERWSQVVDTFLQLFETTTAHQLFEPVLRLDNDEQGAMAASDRRRAFKQIIVKCVLQLLLIETTHELLTNVSVYSAIPATELLRLTQVLEDSYRFSKRFNADKELRIELWKVGFMKQLPNLLKQESSSAATLVHILSRMHSDYPEMCLEIRQRLVPLGYDIVEGFLPLDQETQSRNILAWTPVVSEVLSALTSFPNQVFNQHAKRFYPLAVDLLLKTNSSSSLEIIQSLHGFLYKIGIVCHLLDPIKDDERKKFIQLGKDREKLLGQDLRRRRPSSSSSSTMKDILHLPPPPPTPTPILDHSSSIDDDDNNNTDDSSQDIPIEESNSQQQLPSSSSSSSQEEQEENPSFDPSSTFST